MEKKLEGIQLMEKKVPYFENEIRKVWVVIDDRAKGTGERVSPLQERLELINMGFTLMSTRVREIERKRDELHEEVTYLQSQ